MNPSSLQRLAPSLIALALLPLSAAIGRPSAPASVPRPTVVQDDNKAEYERRLAEAEGSVEKLWKVYDWCDARAMDREGRSVLRKILKLDDNDRKAHELLGEVEYDGKWFPNEKKRDEYKTKQLAEEAKRTGKVLFKGELVDAADLPYLEKGMQRLPSGEWVSAEDYKRTTEGWLKQDFEWVSPEEAPNLDKGLWKCGDKWLTVEEANAYHSTLDKCWKVPHAYFVVYSTCPRDIVDKVLNECDRAFREFNRVLGKTPGQRVPLLILNSLEQYKYFASSPDGVAVELRPFSSLYASTIAEVWMPPLREGLTSAGVTYWNKNNEADNNRGPIFARNAAAQALIEGLDPSPKAFASLMANKAGNSFPQDWWREKKLPEWFRYGAISYVERYIQDQYVGSTGNPNWIRDWSKENLARVGGVDPIDTILGCALSLDRYDASTKLLNETGLLMHFILDGKHPPVVEAHGALKAAFKEGKDLKAPIKALETALRKSEAEFRKFAGI